MRIKKIKAKIKKILPTHLLIIYLFLKSFSFRPKEGISLIRFLFKSNPQASFFKRIFIIKQLYVISGNIPCEHTQHEMISVIQTILHTSLDTKGCVVEAGCYKGGSTAKFSIATNLTNRKLVVFDSFEGLPENEEPHEKNIFGGGASFTKGRYCGTLEEVKCNITKFGKLNSCEFIKGWFDDTMPFFSKPVVAIYLDVDLASSTRTCIKYLYPLLVPGGILYSQDCHLPLVINVIKDDEFWEKEVGYPKPYIEDLGTQKLIKIVKPVNTKK